jgi:hypothetical protein
MKLGGFGWNELCLVKKHSCVTEAAWHSVHRNYGIEDPIGQINKPHFPRGLEFQYLHYEGQSRFVKISSNANFQFDN